MQILIRTACMRNDLLNEQDFLTSTPQRSCKVQLKVPTTLV
jgi:hypothetical protein